MGVASDGPGPAHDRSSRIAISDEAKTRTSPGPRTTGRTIPDRTIPDRTIPDRTIPDRTIADRTIADRTIADRTIADRTIPRSVIIAEFLRLPPSFHGDDHGFGAGRAGQAVRGGLGAGRYGAGCPVRALHRGPPGAGPRTARHPASLSPTIPDRTIPRSVIIAEFLRLPPSFHGDDHGFGPGAGRPGGPGRSSSGRYGAGCPVRARRPVRARCPVRALHRGRPGGRPTTARPFRMLPDEPQTRTSPRSGDHRRVLRLPPSFHGDDHGVGWARGGAGSSGRNTSRGEHEPGNTSQENTSRRTQAGEHKPGGMSRRNDPVYTCPRDVQRAQGRSASPGTFSEPRDVQRAQGRSASPGTFSEPWEVQSARPRCRFRCPVCTLLTPGTVPASTVTTRRSVSSSKCPPMVTTPSAT